MNLRTVRVRARLARAESRRRLARSAPTIRTATLTVGGLGAVSYGGWMWWHPLGAVLGGLSLLIIEALSNGEGHR